METGEAAAPRPGLAPVQPELEAALAAPGASARAIVNLRAREPSLGPLQTAPAEDTEQRWDGLQVTRRYAHVPALAIELNRAALQRLREDPQVESVQLDGAGSGQLREALPALGGDQARSRFAVSGRGVRVAVLDTGVASEHPDLRGSVVAEACFTQRDCAPHAENEGLSADDDHGHGSHVTGIITSDGVIAPPGFAPDAEIVAVKINGADNAGFESDWIAGLDWIYANLAVSDVKVVNLSICTRVMHATVADCDRAHPALARAIANLLGAGVTVFASSGNRGSSSLMAAPACISGVIAVGATYDADVGRQPAAGGNYAPRWGANFGDCHDDTTGFDRIACFTNSNARLDLVAPGAPMLSDTLGGRTATYWGTSQAAPVAAGVAALMLECEPRLSPGEIKSAMQETGVPVMDPKNGLSFPSLRALEALRAVCGSQKREALAPDIDKSSGASFGPRAAAGAPDVDRPSASQGGTCRTLDRPHRAGGAAAGLAFLALTLIALTRLWSRMG